MKLHINPYLANVELLEENGKYFYLGAQIVTGGAGGTLNNRNKLGYTIYYNPITKDKKTIIDYDLERAKTSNDENCIYKDNTELLEKGYIKIRPPKKGNKLGRWTWSAEKFNNEKEVTTANVENIKEENKTIFQKIIDCIIKLFNIISLH